MRTTLPTLLAVGLCLAACSKKRAFTDGPEDGSGGGAGSSNGPDVGGAGGAGSGAASGGGSGGGSDTGPCADHDCENDATCEEDGDSYTCVCPDGFEGDRCETDIDECADEPCENGGTCSNEAGGYECECPADWAGQNCHLPRFEILPEGFTPERLSADGTVVIGRTDNLSNARATQYSGGQLRDLGVYSGDSNSEALALSADGETIVGSSGFTSGELQGRRAIRWRGTSMTQLPKVDEEDLCRATGATADGETIVGICSSRVVRWTSDGVEDIGLPPSTMFCNDALVSADGSLLMATCSQSGDSKVFVHTSAEGFSMLASQPSNCRVRDISTDASVAIANCGSGNGYSSFKWTPAGGLVPSEVRVAWSALTSAGEFTVGYFTTPDYYQYGTRWNGDGDQEDIGDVLSDAGVDVGDVVAFPTVIDVSDDGKTYLGGGELDTEETVLWIARL